MIEQWKDIISYEGLYQISNFGQVRSLGKGQGNNSKPKLLKNRIDKNGYIHARLYKNSIQKSFCCHRLVAIHFFSKPNEQTMC